MQGEAGCTLPTPPWLHFSGVLGRIGRRGLVVFVGTFAILFNEPIPWVVGSRPTLCAYMKFFWICFTTNLMQYWNNIGITADLNIFFVNDEDMFTWWATNRLWMMQTAQCFHDTHFIMSWVFDHTLLRGTCKFYILWPAHVQHGNWTIRPSLLSVQKITSS